LALQHHFPNAPLESASFITTLTNVANKLLAWASKCEAQTEKSMNTIQKSSEMFQHATNNLVQKIDALSKQNTMSVTKSSQWYTKFTSNVAEKMYKQMNCNKDCTKHLLHEVEGHIKAPQGAPPKNAQKFMRTNSITSSSDDRPTLKRPIASSSNVPTKKPCVLSNKVKKKKKKKKEKKMKEQK
jgi:hypothetical protein